MRIPMSEDTMKKILDTKALAVKPWCIFIINLEKTKCVKRM